jgi:hypothetical protein
MRKIKNLQHVSRKCVKVCSGLGQTTCITNQAEAARANVGPRDTLQDLFLPRASSASSASSSTVGSNGDGASASSL